MMVHDYVSSSIYTKDGVINALVWNPSGTSQTIFFVDPDGDIISKSIGAKSFTTIKLS